MKRYVSFELCLEIFEQVDHLGLNRNVERRDRLVADDELRIDRQCAGHADALPLPSREFVRITVRMVGLETHQLEQFADALPNRFARRQAVDAQRFGDDLADGHPRVQRRERILEDDLHRAPQPADLAPIHL